MSAIFVDAYYFIALLNPRDSGHHAARAFSQGQSHKIVTTEWVLVEVGNALSAPPLRSKFVQLVASLRARQATIVHSTPTLFENSLELYRDRPDKGWSLTDCLSFLVMQELGITEALTADVHFQQAGFTIRLTTP